MTRKKMAHSTTVVLVLFLFLIILTVSSCGCIKIMQKSLASEEQEPDSAASATIVPPSDITPDQTTAPVLPGIRTIPITPARPVLVEEAVPIVEDDPYKTLHATRINQTSEYNRQVRSPGFVKTYTLQSNATGLIINVTKGPLIIEFDVMPVYDCLDNPDSCRGTLMTSVNRPYCTITVRNYDTHEIVAQDGYAREYSSQKTDRSITVFGEDRYHITLEGSYLDVRIAIATGDSPFKMNTRDYEEDDY